MCWELVLEGFHRFQLLIGRAIARLERRSLAFAVLTAATKDFNENNCVHLAAGIAYYAIFSIFPLILGTIAVSSYLLQSAETRDVVISSISTFLPGTAEVVRRNIDLVLRERETIGVLAVATLLWSAKAVFAAITTSLNLAWHVRETRPFLSRTALELGMVFAVGFFLMVSFALTAALQLVATLDIPVLGSLTLGEDFWNLLGFFPPLALTIVAFFIAYRFVPNAEVTAREAWLGAATSGVLFEIAKNLFVLYTSEFANYQLVYGSIAAVIAFLFWAWISSVIMLFGAEICSAYASRRAR